MIRKRAALLFLLSICMILLLNSPVALAQGNQAVDFNLPSIYGGKLSLSDFKGRVVLLDFFATWCRPCKDGIPKLNKLQQEYAGKGVSVVGFSLDTGGLSVVKPFAVRNNVEFPVVMGDKDLAIKLGQVKVLPTTLVIDPQGRVVDRFEGLASEEKLLAAVKPYLNASAPPAPTAAMVRNRQPNEPRFTSVYVEDNHELGGARGLAVYVRAEVTDLVPEQGLWLRLDLQPVGKGAGAVKSLYQRIEDGTKNRHVLFVRCDQLPPVPPDGQLKASLTILGAGQKPVEKSPEVEVPRPCQYGQGLASRSEGGRDHVSIPSKEGDSAPAWGNNDEKGQPRFQRIWVSDDSEGAGKPGLSVHVLADLSDLKSQKALWMQLNLQPEVRSKSGDMTPAGEPKALYVRVEDPTRQNFQLYVRCDQLPKVPDGGAFRAWLNILGGDKQSLEKSNDFMIPGPCQVAARAR
ncbi:MAG: TlpA family protein disulfide reductase [Desulfarculus sp.]|nr:TlpA family protein disulfide reductase [Desulfarculus sp.]